MGESVLSSLWKISMSEKLKSWDEEAAHKTTSPMLKAEYKAIDSYSKH